MAKKRGNGRGSVTKHGEGWRLRWHKPTGGRGSKVIGKMLKKEAEAQLREILSALDAGSTFDEQKGKTRFSEFAQHVLDKRLEAGEVELSYARNWQSLFRTTLFPTFGTMRLMDITAQVVDDWWSASSVRPQNRKNAYSALRFIMRRALKYGYVRLDPCRSRSLARTIPSPGRSGARMIWLVYSPTWTRPSRRSCSSPAVGPCASVRPSASTAVTTTAPRVA